MSGTWQGAYKMGAIDYTDGYVQECRMVDIDAELGGPEKPSSRVAHSLTDGLTN